MREINDEPGEQEHGMNSDESCENEMSDYDLLQQSHSKRRSIRLRDLSPIKAVEDVNNVSFLHEVVRYASEIAVTYFEPGSGNMREATETFQNSGSTEKI